MANSVLLRYICMIYFVLDRLKRRRQPAVVRPSPTRPYAQQLFDPAPPINDYASELASAIAAIPGVVGEYCFNYLVAD